MNNAIALIFGRYLRLMVPYKMAPSVDVSCSPNGRQGAPFIPPTLSFYKMTKKATSRIGFIFPSRDRVPREVPQVREFKKSRS